MKDNVYIYRDKDNKPCNMFLKSNPRIDAIKVKQDNVNHETFWQVRILPDNPTGNPRIVAQCDSMDEAIEKMMMC